MSTKNPGVEKIVVKGALSDFSIELDLQIIKTVMEWFVSDAPKEMRNLHNIGRVIRMNDSLIELISKETKHSLDYIEKRAIERIGIDDKDERYEYGKEDFRELRGV